MTSVSCSVRSIVAGAARVPVSVNGVTIAHDAISREAQNHPAAKPIEAWRAAARALAVCELLLQEARRCGLRADPLADAEGRRETDEEALVRGLIEVHVRTPAPDEDACRRYYEHNRARFRSADIYEAGHILVAARRDDAASFKAARERAAAIHAHLEREPQRFAEQAKAHSDCPSGASGGNLGQLTAGDTTPEFEQALLALKPGDVSAVPVETRYGFHVIRLDRHVPGRQLPFEIARERIAAYLAERTQRLAIAQFVARLAARADVAGVELPTPGDLRVH